ncbi:MAG: DUF1800 domain-containing protein [Flavobacteriaceae bacterium]|nr:DUF1800 domain-containing protein [Flavobacteriaceae bacterium]
METITSPSCNTATLDPYIPNGSNPWDIIKINHVYRRLGFGASQTTVDAALGQTPNDFIDSIVDTASNTPPTATPFWGYYNFNNFSDFETENPEYINNWFIQTGNDFISEDLRGRIVAFWLNHFVTGIQTYNYSPYLFQYYNTVQTHALGNLKDFVRAIGINPAMLLYLNGFENTNTEPNENYARELYELFTLGEGNGYLQADIVDTAKALTGYNHWNEAGGTIYFDNSTFWDGDKTIFGQTGNWGYNDVIDILFQEKGDLVAFYICEKLYKYFVSPEVDVDIKANIIQPLSQTLIDNNYELLPMLKQLFKSEHFFNERGLGVVIKSPFDIIFQFINETEFFYNNEVMGYFLYFAGQFGQDIYDPPDVSGWQRDEDWISTSTLTGRWDFFKIYLSYLYDLGLQNSFVDFAKDLTNDSNDPNFITQVLIDHFVSKELHTITDYDVATDIFKWEVPQNYYDDGLWNLDWPDAPYQVFLLLVHIATIPEFQLK